MSKKDLQDLLSRLEESLASEDLPSETRGLLGELQAQLESLEDSSDDDVESPMLLTTKALEAEFAARHPAAERLLRELIDTLVKMGV